MCQDRTPKEKVREALKIIKTVIKVTHQITQ